MEFENRLTSRARDVLIAVYMKRPVKETPTLKRLVDEGLVLYGVPPVFGTYYILSEEGRNRAVAFVSCPCGWWQKAGSIEMQGGLEKNLERHQADCAEARGAR